MMKQEERARVYFSEDGVCVREGQQGAKCVFFFAVKGNFLFGRARESV